MSGAYIRLIGDHWASRSVGYLAVEIITGLALLPALFFVRSFRWVFGGTTDTVRTCVFILSTVSTLIDFILDLTSLGEDEKNAVVSYKYYILYIFLELCYRISEFTIFFVIARTVNQLAFHDFGNAAAHWTGRFLTLILIGIVGVVSMTTFGLIAGYYGSVANGHFSADKLVSAIFGFFVAYNTVYLAASLYVIVVAVLAVARLRAKASLLMLFVAMSLVLRALVYLADVIADYYSHDITSKIHLDWANNFIYNIMTMAIYLGVTAVALIGAGSYGDSMLKQDPGLELAPFASPHVYE